MAGQGEDAPFRFDFALGGVGSGDGSGSGCTGGGSSLPAAAAAVTAAPTRTGPDDSAGRGTACSPHAGGATELGLSGGERGALGGSEGCTLEQLAITPDLYVWKGSVQGGEAAALVGNDAVQGSDLVAGKYEGGFKLWECSLDLAAYAARQWAVRSGMFSGAVSTPMAREGAEALPASQPSAPLPAAAAACPAAAPGSGHGSGSGGAQALPPGAAAVEAGAAAAAAQTGFDAAALVGKRVLELGCGAGVPGIVALLAGAEVHFQDYNEEVLRALTIPNVLANAAQYPAPPPATTAAAVVAAVPGAAAAAGRFVPHARFFSGDWAAFPEHVAGGAMAGEYDVVLSAETIYDTESSRRLLACIKRCLRRPGGVAYIAAKSYYFGVGGSTAAFRALVAADGELRVADGGAIDDGQSNKRELLLLSWAACEDAELELGLNFGPSKNNSSQATDLHGKNG